MLTNIYPVGLNLKNRVCLVVGGGIVAARKIKSLLNCGAEVRVVSPDLIPELKIMAEKQLIDYYPEIFQPPHLQSVYLVVVATDMEEINKKVAAEAEKLGIPVNIVDVPDLCSFIVPALLRRGELTVSIFTGGESPALAKRLRRELEGQFDQMYGNYISALGRMRRIIKGRLQDQERRASIYTWLASKEGEEVFRREGEEGLIKEADKLIIDLGGGSSEINPGESES